MGFYDHVQSTGTLTSPNISSSQPLCIHFYAHMYGASIGQLTLKELNNNNNNTELEKFTGDQGRYWFEVNANISAGRNMTVSVLIIPNN